ncbi:3421_t:CDS:1, partial [Entrophospora sp. SA101]
MVYKGLLDELGLKILQKSSVMIINVNGQKILPLGEVDGLPLTIGGIIILLLAIVIDVNTYNATLKIIGYQ